MATAEEYARWIVANQGKRGTPEFETVAAAYRAVRGDDAKPSKPEPSMAQRIRGFLGPTIEAGGAIGGGLIGAPFGPAGSVAGAGLGYGIAKSGLRAIDEAAGWEPAPSLSGALVRGAKDVAEGATYEAGGRVVMPYLARSAGWVKDLVTGQRIPVKAANIARAAASDSPNAIREALRAAESGSVGSMTAGQATADVNAPAWHALQSRVALRDPGFYGKPGQITPTQEAIHTNAIEALSGGSNQTAMRAARQNAIEELNKRLLPERDAALAAANVAGSTKPRLDAMAQGYEQAAASKVEDVRRFMAAAERAGERAHTTVIGPNGKPVAAVTIVPGYPRQPGRYTYMGELEKTAPKVAAKAAEESLALGAQGRAAREASEAITAQGYGELRAAPIIERLKPMLADLDYAGNDKLLAGLRGVIDDITAYARTNGVIDARALDSIRKNSVNTAIEKAMDGADKKSIEKATAKVLMRVKPLLDDAINTAAGNRAYTEKWLEPYAAGRQAIDRTKMAARAEELWRGNRPAFVNLTQGNAPKEVEKVFGPGQYDIDKLLLPGQVGPMRSAADVAQRSAKSAEMGNYGTEALEKILRHHIVRLRIPWVLNPKVTATNRVIDLFEHRLGTKTMNQLAQAMKTGASAEQLMQIIPATERGLFLNALKQNALPGGPAALGVGLTE